MPIGMPIVTQALGESCASYRFMYSKFMVDTMVTHNDSADVTFNWRGRKQQVYRINMSHADLPEMRSSG